MFDTHDDVIKWKHFPCYWPFVRGIHRSPVNSPHKGQWRGALMFSLIWTNGWVNNQDAGDLRRHRTNYDVTVKSRCDMSWHRPAPLHMMMTMFRLMGVGPSRNIVMTGLGGWSGSRNHIRYSPTNYLSREIRRFLLDSFLSKIHSTPQWYIELFVENKTEKTPVKPIFW